MTSTSRSAAQPVQQEASEMLAWRRWPLVDWPRSSWLVVVMIACLGASVWYSGGGWVLGVTAAAGLAATFWSYLLPVNYEVASIGLRRRVWNHTRLVPWHAIRAYQLRPSGVVLYQRSDPGAIDVLRSMFVPYPSDADELLVALRRYASHAAELGQQ
jgi:hypothetical protein